MLAPFLCSMYSNLANPNLSCPFCRRDYSSELSNPENRRPVTTDENQVFLLEDCREVIARDDVLAAEQQTLEAQSVQVVDGGFFLGNLEIVLNRSDLLFVRYIARAIELGEDPNDPDIILLWVVASLVRRGHG